jgi:hypothetical protein
MNHTSTINVWEGNNRVSQLWEVLLVERVAPDPVAGEYRSPVVDLKSSLPLEPWGPEESSYTTDGGQNHSPIPALLEKAGFESLRLFRHALEVLTAPAEEEPVLEVGREHELNRMPVSPGDPDMVLTFVKVSMEPEPQPGSTIDTRRMAYGLKIPLKPLHKRPIYQRIFFSLRHIMTRGKEQASLRRYG